MHNHLLMELMQPNDSPPLRAWPTSYKSRLLDPKKTKIALRSNQLFYVRNSYLETNPKFIAACIELSGLFGTPLLASEWWTFTRVKSEYSFALTKREWQAILCSMSPADFSREYLQTKITCIGNLVKQRIAILPLITVSCPVSLDVDTFAAIHAADREWRKHKELL